MHRALEPRDHRRPRTLHRHGRASRYHRSDERPQLNGFMTATETTTTVVVPGTHLMAALVGPRDQLPPPGRAGVPAHRDQRPRQRGHGPGRAVRAGRPALRGARRPAAARPRARRGQPAPRHRHGRRRRAAERDPDPGRPARRQGPPGPPEVGRPEALHRRHRAQRHHVRHRPRRHRQVVARRGDGRQGAAGQAGPAHHPHPARPSRRASGSASCPAT